MVFLEIPNMPKGTVFAEKVTYIIIISWTFVEFTLIIISILKHLM